jgi:hypothetical protein
VRPAKHAAGATSPTETLSSPPATASPAKRPRCLSDDADPPSAAASAPSNSSPAKASPVAQPGSASADADALATLAGYSDSDDDAGGS